MKKSQNVWTKSAFTPLIYSSKKKKKNNLENAIQIQVGIEFSN